MENMYYRKMFWLNLKRILKYGFINFWRNSWVSVATVLVLFLTLFVMGSLFFANMLLTVSLEKIQDKVDISVYFQTSASEENIFSLIKSLKLLGEVQSVEYMSPGQVLERFQSQHKDNALIAQSLEELGYNPLGASLNIKAKEPQQYESIARFLENSSYQSIIDKISYRQNKLVIDRLTSIISTSRKIGIGITLVLSAIAILVAFNTIRIAIYSNREEIAIMRLVGGSSRYIEGPFLVEGLIHGLLSAILVMIVAYPLTLWFGPKTERFFGGPNIFDYFISNFFQFFFILLGIGILLGVFSSLIAIRRYLKV